MKNHLNSTKLILCVSYTCNILCYLGILPGFSVERVWNIGMLFYYNLEPKSILHVKLKMVYCNTQSDNFVLLSDLKKKIWGHCCQAEYSSMFPFWKRLYKMETGTYHKFYWLLFSETWCKIGCFNFVILNCIIPVGHCPGTKWRLQKFENCSNIKLKSDINF